MKKSMVETTILNELSKRLEEIEYSIPTDFLGKVVNGVFRGMASFLSVSKKKDKPVALVVKDLKGNFLMGTIVQYFPGEDDNDPGNWSLVYSLDEEDIKDGMEVIDITNSAFQTLLSTITKKHFNFNFKSSEMCWNILISIANTMKSWLDANCKDNGEKTELESEGYFTASVALENGEKVMAIEPSGEMKQLVKSDATLA